jgi:hypothetical protein
MSKKTEHHLDPSWVKILHPNVKQHRGLMLVIKGEHVGKFGMRVCHYSGEKDMALVAFIHCVEGMRPTLTGEEARLFPDELAIVEQTKDEKNLTTACIASWRKAAQ